MSNSVDQRIVEMQFDNSSFERGVAKTMATLESFDKVLGGTKGFEALKNVASKIDTSAAESSLGGLGGAFDGVADIAQSAFSRISSAMSAVGKGVGIVTGLINTGIAGIAVKGGLDRAMNLADAKFKLEQLKVSWDSVGGIIQESVNDTAFGLGDAAIAAASLTASGITAENGLKETLKATANLASVSGIEYSRVAQLMGQIASQGKLGGMQMESFSIAGINIAGILADVWQTSEESVRDMVHKGTINLEMFRDAMNTKLGDGAKAAQNTFSGSLANMKAALSRTTADLLGEGMEALVPLFNALRININSVNTALNPLMRIAGDGTKGVLIEGFRKMTEGAAEAFKEYSAVFDKEGKVIAGELTPSMKLLGEFVKALSDSMVGFFDSVGGGMKSFTTSLLVSGDILIQIVRIFSELVSPLFIALNDVFGGNTFNNFATGMQNGLVGIRDTLASFKVSSAYVKILSSALSLLFTVVRTAGGVAFSLLGGALQVVVTLATFAAKAVMALFEIINGVGNAIVIFVSSVFGDLFGFITGLANESNVLSSIGDFIASIGEAVMMIRDAIAGEDGALDRFFGAIGKVNETGSAAWDSLASALSNVGAALKDFGEAFASSALDLAGRAFEKLQKIGEKVWPVIERVRDALASFWDMLKTAFMNSGFSLEPILNMFGSMGDAIGEFIDALLGDSFSFDNVTELFSNFGKAFEDCLSSMLPSFQKFFGEIGEQIYASVDGPMKNLLDWVLSIQNPLDMIAGAFDRIADSVSKGIGSFRLPWAGGESAAAAEGAEEFSEAVETGFNAMDMFSALVEALTHPVETALGLVSGLLNGAAKAVNQFIDNLATEEIAKFVETFGKLAVLGGLAVGVQKAVKLLDSISSALKGFANIGKAIANVGESLSNAVNTLSTSMKMSAVLMIAVSIGILVGALVVLTLVDYSKLSQVFPMLMGMLISLSAILVVIGKIKIDVGAMAAFSSAMGSIALAMLVMSGALYIMGSLDKAAMDQALFAVIVIGAIMIALAALTKNGSSIGQVGASLMQMAIAIAILTVVAAAIGYLVQNHGTTMLIGGAIVLGMIVLLSAIAIALSRLAGDKALPAVSSLVVMAAAIAILSVCIAALAMLPDLGKAIASAIMVGVLLAEMAVIIYALSNLENTGNLVGAAASLVIMAAAMGILVAAIAGIAILDSLGADVTFAWIVVAGMLIMMAAAIAIIAGAGPQAEIASGALIALCVGLALVAGIIIVFANTPWQQLLVGCLIAAVAAGILIGAFAGIAVIGEFLAAGVAAVSAFTIAIAALVLSIGLSAMLLVTAFTTMADAGPEAVERFLQTLSALGQGLWNIKGDLALGVAGIGMAIIGGIITLIPSVVGAVVALVAGIAVAIVSIAPMLGVALIAALAMVVEGLATGLETFGPMLLDAIVHLGTVIMDGIQSILGMAGDAIMNKVHELTGGIFGYGPEANQAGQSVGQEVTSGTETGMSPLSEKGVAKINEMLGGVEGQKSAAGAAGGILGNALADGTTSPISGLSEAVQGQMNGIPNIATDTGGQFMENLDGTVNGESFSLDGLMSQFQDAGVQIPEVGAESIAGYGENLESGAESIDVSGALTQDIDSGAVVDKFSQTGVDAATGFNDSFNANLHIDTNALSAPLQNTGAFGTAGNQAGTQYVNSLSSSLSRASTVARTAGSNVVQSIKTGGSGAYSAGYDVGSNLSSGVSAGLGAYQGSINAKAEAIIDAIKRVMEAKAQVKSPSKMTARIGAYLVEGLIVGLESTSYQVERSAENVMGSILQAMAVKPSFGGYFDNLLGDINENPTVTPVLDLDEYANGIAAMMAMMPANQYMMAAGIMGYNSAMNPFSHRDSEGSGTVNNYYIELNYSRDMDANQVVDDITSELRYRNMMEAR